MDNTKALFIDGYKTCYRISIDGSIINTETNKKISGWIGKRGYRVASIKIQEKDSIMFKFVKKQIHRLVAQTFIPNPENKPQVNHKDGNKLNNHVDNLEWVTNKENYDHARNLGLIKTCGDLSYATVDNETVEKICKLLEMGKRNIEIITELGLPNDQHGKGLITRIRVGRSWKDISRKYSFIKTGSLKKVPDELIHEICIRLEKNYPLKKIFTEIGAERMEYTRFKGLVYDIRTHKIHKNISEKYKF